MIVTLLSLLGLLIGICIGISVVDGYKSKKTCRECRHRIVEYGFMSDGKTYKAVECEK